MHGFVSKLALISVVSAAFAAPALSQTATSGPTVTDANGKVVGTLVSAGEVMIKFADGEALLAITTSGLSNIERLNPVDTRQYFATANCTGPTYVRVDQVPNYGYFDPAPPAATAAYSSGGTIYYAKRPFSFITALSYKVTGLSANGACWPTTPDHRTFYAGRLGSSGYYPRLTLPILVK